MSPNAPERIWLTREDTGASWSGSFRVFRACDLEHEDCPEYASADLLDAAQARVAELEAALEAIRDGYGPSHMSKFARDRARAALNPTGEA